ncbi:MAG: hypothetical protein F6K39_40965 [Okeania sp. SIO3B3]|nr:hypothetical protein [Okeania sp. SIO3B3]
MPSNINIISYSKGQVDEFESNDINEVLSKFDSKRVNWITIRDVGLDDRPLVEHVLSFFELDPFLADDILDDNFVVFEGEYDTCLYLEYSVLPADRYLTETTTTKERGCLILGTNFLLLFKLNDLGIFAKTRRKIITGHTKALRHGADYLLYLLVRATIIAEYDLMFKELAHRLESLEDEILARPGDQLIFQKILTLRAKIKPLYNDIVGVIDFVEELRDEDSKFITSDTIKLFTKTLYREGQDLLQEYQLIRTWLNELRELHRANINDNINRVMKILTVVSTIFLPLTFLVGVYGMNFQYIPELQLRWAYPACWMTMITTSIGVVVFMWYQKWL